MAESNSKIPCDEEDSLQEEKPVPSAAEDGAERSEVNEEHQVANFVCPLSAAEGAVLHACEEHQPAEEVCECVCDCETFEEAHPMAFHLAILCHCTDDEPQRAVFDCECEEGYEAHHQLYYLHCCGCGVQVAPDNDPHGEDGQDDSPNGNPRRNRQRHNRDSPNREAGEPFRRLQEPRDPGNINPGQDHEVGNAPPPPPPPPVMNENQRMTRRNNVMSPAVQIKAISNEDGGPSDTRLHEAARAKDVERLRKLFDEEKLGKNINNKVKPFMATPLRDAVSAGSLECVRLLLSKGAEVDVVDVKGQTPLFVASSWGYPAIMEALLSRGANPEGSSMNSCTPLLLCVRDGCLEGVRVLLEYGADPQPVSMLATVAPGWPLQHCIVYRHFRCFVALLRGGAETSLLKVIQNKKGLEEHQLEPGLMQRLSIARTVLRHASDMPEFLLAYREFGGTFEGQEHLAEDMRTTDCPALRTLNYCYDNPSSLKSLCRMNLFRTIGPKRLPLALSTLRLPSSLAHYLQYDDVISNSKRGFDTQPL